MQHISPHLPNIMHLRKLLQTRITQWVGGCRSRIRERAEAFGAVEDILADYEVFCVCRGLCHPAGGEGGGGGLVRCLAGRGRGGGRGTWLRREAENRGGRKGKGKEERAEGVGMCMARGEREKGVPRKRGKKRKEARNVLSHSITPPLAHPTRLSSLQAPPSTTTRHTVSDSMGHLVDHDVILHRSITAGLKKMEYQNALSGVKSEKKTHVGKRPYEHPTLTRLPTTSIPIISSSPILPKEEREKKRHSLRRRSKIRIINPRSILHTH